MLSLSPCDVVRIVTALPHRCFQVCGACAKRGRVGLASLEPRGTFEIGAVTARQARNDRAADFRRNLPNRLRVGRRRRECHCDGRWEIVRGAFLDEGSAYGVHTVVSAEGKGSRARVAVANRIHIVVR